MGEIRADLGLGPLPGGDVPLVTTPTGLVPIVLTRVPVGKDWHFDPTQPRDAQGRWTAGSGDESDGKIIPAQEIILPFDSTEFPEFEQLKQMPFEKGQVEGNPPIDQQPNTTETAIIRDPRYTKPGSQGITDSTTGMTYYPPSDLSEDEKDECIAQWRRGNIICKELDKKRDLNEYSSIGKNLADCIRNWMNPECGGTASVR